MLPVISVVIPTIDGREDHYERCRAAYIDGADAGDYELELIAVRNEPTCGWGWQTGAERMSSRSQYLHFTCDDIEPQPGWAAPAIEALERQVMPAPRVYNGYTGKPEYFPAWGREYDDWTPAGMSALPFMTRDLWETHISPMLTCHYFCCVPTTPVLTADLEWVPVGKLVPGDELIGVDEFNEPRRDRKFRPATVLANSPIMRDCLTVHLEDGREVICSTDHPWLVKRWHSGARGSSYAWIETRQLREGDRIASPLNPWDTENTYEAGWLGGMLDGEGTIDSSRLSVGQNPGPVLDELRAQLRLRGIDFREYPNSKQSRVVNLMVGQNRQAWELLGRTRPRRLITARPWDGVSIRSRTDQPGIVVRIERAGRREVSALGTSTRTFLANGLVSHNTDNWCTFRAARAGLQAKVRHGYDFMHYWADTDRGAGMEYGERLRHDHNLFNMAVARAARGHWAEPWPPREESRRRG